MPVRAPYAWWVMTSSQAAASGCSKRIGLSASTSNVKHAAARTPSGQRNPGGIG